MKFKSFNIKYLPIFFILILGFTSCIKNESTEYILEIIDENGSIHEKMILNHNEIEQIGLDERRGAGVGVKLVLANTFSVDIKELTAKHIGKRLSIRRNKNTLISAIIREPIESGYLFINFDDKNDALKFINEFGREPDFHLKYTKKELEESEEYLRPARNPYRKKSMDALLQKDYSLAEKTALKAIESEPNETSHYIWLGYVYHEMNRPNLEIQQLLKAKSLVGPNDRIPGLYLSIGSFYTRSGDYRSAISTYEEYLSKHGSYLLINESLAKAYEENGDFTEALNQYNLLSRSGDTHFENIGTDGIERVTKEK
jgi:tetratricopeptide (TPR) repeat protein